MASSGIIEDHIVKRFNTTITVIDEKTVHVSIDYGFTWLNSNYSRDMWYVYVGTDAYGIITEDEKGPLNYSTNYSIENGWAPVRLREGVNAGQSCYFKVSYYAENYITPAGQGQSQQKQYRLGMWAVWDNARKEDVAIKVNFPSWFSISSYDLSFLKAGTTQDGGTVLTARMQNVSYDTNYYLGVDLITKQDTSGWRYVPNVIVFNWTRSIMAEVPASLILAVNNLGNGTAYLTNTTVSAPAILNLRGNSINEIGKLRPFETRYLYFTVNASSAGASYIFTTIAYNYGNGTVRIQKSNCTVDVTRHMYESVVACNIEPDSAEISKETSLNYVMVPIRNASISVSLIRPDGSVFSKVSRNVTYGSFTIRFAPDVAGNWTANLEVPEISSYRSARMNTIFLVHSTNFYSSRILSSDNKKLVASYDVKEVYTFTNNGTETEQSPTFDVSLYVTLPTQDVTLLDMNPLPINLSYNYSGLRAKFSTPELDPEENFTIVVRFNVKLLALPPVIDDFNGTLGEIPTEFLKYTGYAKYWETNDTSIQNLSSSLTANQTTVLGKARAIYLWIADNIKYDSDKLNAIERGEPTEQYTAPQTLALRKGICEDISNLFITLCRASGIPAIGIGGNPYNGVNGSDNIKSSHAWSAAYIPGYGWIEVDATWKQFGRLDYVHVARSSGRDTPGAGGYYWWGINNATVYDEHLYMTRMSTTVGDNTYQSINELDTNLLIGIFIIVAIITAVATVPFIIMKKRRDRRYSSI
jgi:transglutaminase-like putative cysteine protease